MKITFTISAYVLEKDSRAQIFAPEVFDGSRLADGLDGHLDSDIADAGVIGGEIIASSRGGRIELKVSFRAPSGASCELIESLRQYSMAQLDDGVGEGGFDVDADGKRLLIVANTEIPVRLETTDDGEPVPAPSRIAIAARDGDLESLRSEIAKNHAVDATHQGYTGLHLAVLYGHEEAAQLRLAAGANPNQLDPQGATPLQLTALSNSLSDDESAQLAKLLLGRGADSRHQAPNSKSAKSYAENRGKFRMAELL